MASVSPASAARVHQRRASSSSGGSSCSASRTPPSPGTYKVFGKAMKSQSKFFPEITMSFMTRLPSAPTRRATSASMPSRSRTAKPMQTENQLGSYGSDGCVRMNEADAISSSTDPPWARRWSSWPDPARLAAVSNPAKMHLHPTKVRLRTIGDGDSGHERQTAHRQLMVRRAAGAVGLVALLFALTACPSSTQSGHDPGSVANPEQRARQVLAGLVTRYNVISANAGAGAAAQLNELNPPW